MCFRRLSIIHRSSFIIHKYSLPPHLKGHFREKSAEMERFVGCNGQLVDFALKTRVFVPAWRRGHSEPESRGNIRSVPSANDDGPMIPPQYTYSFRVCQVLFNKFFVTWQNVSFF